MAVTYIRYVLENIEPLRIANLSSSQNGQIATLKYIPGTTIRGYVISRLAAEQSLDVYKPELFSDALRFLNAYPKVEDKALFPSPKGFYEDKTEAVNGSKEIENVVIDGKFSSGNKRAGLGGFSYFEKDTVAFYSVETDEDIKLRLANFNHGIEKTNMSHSEHIKKGHHFEGYIAMDAAPEKMQELQKMLLKLFFEGSELRLGSARSAGLGKCRVVKAEIMDRVPYEKEDVTEYEKEDEKEQEKFCYMLLLSHTVMRNEMGEYCGLNLKELEEYMGVKNLRIKESSTSIVTVQGYNRTWGLPLPAVTMYEQGSVFKLAYDLDSSFTVKKAQELMNQGIGVRRNEGFGRVLFLENYEEINKKQEIAFLQKTASLKLSVKEREQHRKPELEGLSEEDQKVLKQAAKVYVRMCLNEKLKEKLNEAEGGRSVEQRLTCAEAISELASSKITEIRARLSYCRYQEPEIALDEIRKYFEHAIEKENNTRYQVGEFKSIELLKKYILGTLDSSNSLSKILARDDFFGYSLTELDIDAKEEFQWKLWLLLEELRYQKKAGGNKNVTV